MLNVIGLGVNIPPRRISSRHSEQQPSTPPSCVDRASSASLGSSRAAMTVNSPLSGGSISSHKEQPSTTKEQTTSAGRPPVITRPTERASEGTFSRHDSLFSFGVTSSRNAAELKSFLGNSSSRLKPGATVLPLQAESTNGRATGCNAVFLEQAKTRARVEVDIVLENDCCIEGGYLRGTIKIRVRRRQKREAPLLLADGKIRVIGFESILGVSDRHAFYQRASPLCAATDTSASIYNSPPDAEGFAHVMEGVHVLPFAMHLPVDSESGAPKGSPVLQNGVAVRYIAMVSVKVKDSKTGKRSIAHFYRDCQVWPCLDLNSVLASAPRPVQASTARSMSVLGGGHKVKLTAILCRLTHVAGQRCYVRVSVVNETKKSVKTLTLTLIRTTTLFKPKPALDYGGHSSADPDACQTATSHKVVAESTLERSHGVTKGHASAQGWWTGVSAGQEAQFAHYVLIPPDALSVTRARLIEVEYSIRVSLGAGALTSDVQVTLPVRIVNFLSLDPIPSAPLFSSDGSYARLVPQYDIDEEKSPSANCLSAGKPTSACPSTGRARTAAGEPSPHDNIHSDGPTTIADHGSAEADNGACLRPCGSALQVVNPDSTMGQTPSDSDNSLYSTDSYASAISSSSVSSSRESSHPSAISGLGNVDLPEGASSDDDLVNHVLRSTTQQDSPSRILSASADALEACETAADASDLLGDEDIPAATGPAPIYKNLASCSPVPQPASLRSSHTRPAGPRRFASTTACEPQTQSNASPASKPTEEHRSGAHTPTEDSLARTACVSPKPVPVRPERSPLRARTGRWDRRPLTAIGGPAGASASAGAQGAARTSFERRVQEKKQALLEAQVHATPERALREPSQHVREPGASDVSGARARGQDTEEDGDDTTPRLGYTLEERGFVVRCHGPPTVGAPAGDDLLSDGGVYCPPSRPSRQLPLPPPRPSCIRSSSSSGPDAANVDGSIPESVSALEALRASQLCGTSMPSGSVRRELRPRGSRLLAEPSAIDTPPPLVLSSSSSSSAHSASSQESRAYETLPVSLTDACIARPTEGLYSVGTSEKSIVQGRIAAFEERLKVSHETGAAYT
ncbi:hypothetical protein GY45DRAFT_542768 [Cubamyces sp. BRFM 1775]|nr:hypothetical protein GY45DRAFT_542768 [Cubamyces sp. BRFM 1775]